MKRYFLMLMCLTIILTMASCGNRPEIAETETAIDPTESYIIKPVDWVLPYCSTKYETMEEAEAAIGIHLELPEMDMSLTPLYYTSGNMLRVHFVHFLEGYSRSDDGTLLREVDQNIMFVKAPKEDWEMYAGCNRFTEEKVVYVYDYPLVIDFQDGNITQAFWLTGDYGYIIVFDLPDNGYRVEDIIKMAESMSADDHDLLMEELAHPIPFVVDESTGLRAVQHPTLAQAEAAIGFQIDLPELGDSFVPEYYTDADIVIHHDLSGNITEKETLYWMKVKCTQYVYYGDRNNSLRTPESELIFFKSSVPSTVLWFHGISEEKTIDVDGISVRIGYEEGKINRVYCATADFGYLILVSDGEFQEDEVIDMILHLSSNDNKDVFSFS